MFEDEEIREVTRGEQILREKERLETVRRRKQGNLEENISLQANVSKVAERIRSLEETIGMLTKDQVKLQARIDSNTRMIEQDERNIRDAQVKIKALEEPEAAFDDVLQLIDDLENDLFDRTGWVKGQPQRFSPGFARSDLTRIKNDIKQAKRNLRRALEES